MPTGLRSAARLALALALAFCVVLFSGLWIVAVNWVEPVELGFNGDFHASDQSLVIRSLSPQSPAERAGLRPGDRIVRIDGTRLQNAESQSDAWRLHEPGDIVRLTIERPGAPLPIVLVATFRGTTPGDTTEYVATSVRNLLPIPFVVVGLAVLFLRPDDPHAWLLALLFASFVTIPGFPSDFTGVTPLLRPFARAYNAVFLGLLGSLFYWFFAVFPVRSPLDRRAPWLKWAGIAAGLALALPGIRSGSLRVPVPFEVPPIVNSRVPLAYELLFLSLGLVSLIWNFSATRDNQTRRRIRVMVWGAGVGVGPGLVSRALENFAGVTPPTVVATGLTMVLALLPLSFAYAVVRHRVLEIPALIRRSARYLLVQRGFTFVLTLVSIALTLAFAVMIGQYLEPRLALAAPAGVTLGAVFGTMLVWGGLSVHRRVSERIDRAFFRSAYDARTILENLAEQLRTAEHRAEVTSLLAGRLRDALQPTRLVTYLEDPRGGLHTEAADVAQPFRQLDPRTPALARLAARGQPLERTSAGDLAAQDDESLLDMLGADCLVPMIARAGRLAGLIVLGPRRSEEPYSGEDRRLLASVAAQAATALDNIRLAEDIAARLEAERRVSHEMDIAREVQRRLLPDAPPATRTLACAAQCIQARSVGGDCYDYLALGRDRLGLVLADVSGKGVHAALLMANLQAHLRSQISSTPDDPARALGEVNRLLFASTAAQHYATLFLGIYEDDRRRLRYVNCGHNPPVLLGECDEVRRLMPTAPVVGLFDEWECSVGEVTLAPGDVLAVFSDGVTDAPADDIEFGETRLIDELRAVRHREPAEIVDRILSAVQKYSGDTQFDDLTLLVARSIE
jgi:phosphoserine phosphatase RsbU/P